MSNALDKLPAELLDIILNNFDALAYGETDQKYRIYLSTLYALCRTSRTLFVAAEPRLYKEFRSEGLEHGVRPFLRTLCARPDLAARVECLSLEPRYAKRELREDAPELALFMGQMDILKDTDLYQPILDGINDGCYTAELVLMLATTTRLRYLNITTTVFNRRTMLRPLNSHCYACPQMSLCLRNIFAHDCLGTEYTQLSKAFVFARQDSEYDTGMSHSVLFPFFNLPSMKEIRGSRLGSHPSQDQWLALPSTSNVESVALGLGNLNTTYLVQLMDSCKILRNVEAIWSAFCEWPEDDNGGDDDDDDQQGLAFSGQPAFSTLHNFDELHDLQVQDHFSIADGPWANAALHSRLSPNLKSLVIHSTTLDLDGLGVILAACSDYSCPMLEDLQITFAMSEDFEYEWPEVMDDNKRSDDRAWFIGRGVFDTVDSQSELSTAISEHGVRDLLKIQLPYTEEGNDWANVDGALIANEGMSVGEGVYAALVDGGVNAEGQGAFDGVWDTGSGEQQDGVTLGAVGEEQGVGDGEHDFATGFASMNLEEQQSAAGVFRDW